MSNANDLYGKPTPVSLEVFCTPVEQRTYSAPDQKKERYTKKVPCDQMIDVVAHALAKGTPQHRLSHILGVKPSTFNTWYTTGARHHADDRDTQFSRFWKACVNGETFVYGLCTESLLRHVTDGRDYRAPLEVLKKIDPVYWDSAQKVEISMKQQIDKLLTYLEKVLSPNAYIELVNALQKMPEASGED